MARRDHGLLALVGLLGCTMPNPAYESGHGSGDATTTRDDAAATGESSSEIGDETAATGETGTGETGSTETTTTETGPVDECAFDPRPPLPLLLWPPDNLCPPSVGGLYLLLDPMTFNVEPGVASGSSCTDVGCTSCEENTYAVGSPGFAGLAQVWSSLGMLAETEATGVCVEVAAASYVGMADGGCMYAAMGIQDNSFEHGPVFVGNVDGVPLTAIGDNALAAANAAPSPSQAPIATCSCETTKLSAADLGCCDSSGLDPSFYTLSFEGAVLEPGMSAPVQIGAIPWQFHAEQAQAVPGCDNPNGAMQVSWALARVQ